MVQPLRGACTRVCRVVLDVRPEMLSNCELVQDNVDQCAWTVFDLSVCKAFLPMMAETAGSCT